MAQETNTRQFSVSPAIIYSLIKAQAGTLGKGLLECIMNSRDASATRVDIEVSPTTLKVTDNGKGFQTRAEILACFEVFGFEHKQGERVYGQFGIGRAQLWNFCSTVWHTNSFKMDVDIKSRGLDYDLVENVEPVAGLTISGKFYEPLSTSEILATERELKELAMYVGATVTFNGTQINRDPALEKWTHETDDAWIQLSSSSPILSVFNLGVKVKDYSAYQFGCGGRILSKVPLSLNMARNDIILTECSAWKRIRPFLQKKSDEAASRSPRLSEEQLANMAVRFLAGELRYEDIASRKLLVDVLGKKYTLADAFAKIRASTDSALTYAPREDVNPVTEQAHRAGYCFVMGHQSLTRFGVRTLGELVEKLEAVLKTQQAQDYWLVFGSSPGDSSKLFTVVEDWRQACRRVAAGYTDIPHKEWTKRECAAMASLSAIGDIVLRLIRLSGAQESGGTKRELRIGVSEVARAWTDGTDLIWLNRDLLPLLDDGSAGGWTLLSILLHEYLHEDCTSGTHAHDLDFYERFHRVMTLEPNRCYQSSMGYCLQQLMRTYVSECTKRGQPVRARVLSYTDAAEKLSIAA